MKVSEALRERRAVRSFIRDPIAREVLEELVVAAGFAPSYMNLQPWSFAICNDPVAIEGFDQRAKQYLLNSSTSDSSFIVEREELSKPDFTIFYEAPVLIIIYALRAEADDDVACAMAAYGLMLAAHTMGLGSCWVSHAKPWLASVEAYEAIGISSEYRVVAPIILGPPAATPLSPGRFPPKICWFG